MIAIIDYNAGNTRSVANALRRLGVDSIISDRESEIRSADKIIFPGVGAAGAAMEALRAKGLDRMIPELTQPLLGICLGMQLLCSRSEEGNTPCLGIFPVEVREFTGDREIPHMGWNSLTHLEGPLFEGVSPGSDVYFVHSFYAGCGPWTSSGSTYMHSFSASLQKDNFYATQFHPEKSGAVGERILKNFLAL